MLMCGTKSPCVALADRAEREHGIDERRHERPQRELRAAVADEVAQHPRPELGRGQGQCDDHDREHDAHDRDDGRGDRGQDLPGGVGRPADRPAGNLEHAVVGRLVQCERADEQQHGGDAPRWPEPATGWCAARRGATPSRAAGAGSPGCPAAVPDGLHGKPSSDKTVADQSSRLTWSSFYLGRFVPPTSGRLRPAQAGTAVSPRRRGRAAASGRPAATATA